MWPFWDPEDTGKTIAAEIIGGLVRYDSGDLIIKLAFQQRNIKTEMGSLPKSYVGFVFRGYNLISTFRTVLAIMWNWL